MPAALIVFLALMLKTWSTVDEITGPEIGGLAVLIIAGALFFVSARSTVSDKSSNWLVLVGIAMIILWSLTRLIAAFETVTGREFGMLSFLLVALSAMVWRRRGGFLGKLALVVVAVAWIGGSSSMFVSGLSSFTKGLGLTMPKSVSRIVDSVGKDVDRLADLKEAQTRRGEILTRRDVEKSRRVFVKKGTQFYTACPEKDCPELKYSFSKEYTEVVVLGKTLVEKGVELTLIKLPEPGTEDFVSGVEAYVETAQLLTKSEAFGKGEQATGQLSQMFKQALELLKEHWLIAIAVFLILIINRMKKGSYLKTAVLSVVWIVILFMAFGTILYLAENLGGIDLAKSIPNAMRNSAAEKVAEKPEVRINLLDLYTVGQEFQFIKMPDARYKRIVLTETICVRSTGKKYTDKVFAHFGANKKGKARLKRAQSFGYYDVAGSYSRGVFMSLAKGTIIEFDPAEDNTIWFSAGSHRVVLDPSDPDKPVIFAYKEAS